MNLRTLLSCALLFAVATPLVALDDENKGQLKKTVRWQQLGTTELESTETTDEAKGVRLRVSRMVGGNDKWTRKFVHKIGANDQQLDLQIESSSDGDPTIIMNGEEVPEDRLQRDGDKLKVLDENGEVVLELQTSEEGLIFMPDIPLLGHLFEGGAQEPQEKRPMIGISMGPVGEALAHHLEIEDDAIVITEVHEGYPAEAAGLEKHDVITHVDGEPGVTMESLRDAVLDRDHGEFIRLAIFRRGRPMNIVVQVEDRELPGVKYHFPHQVWEETELVEPHEILEHLEVPQLPRPVEPDQVNEKLDDALQQLEKQLEELQKKFEKLNESRR